MIGCMIGDLDTVLIQSLDLFGFKMVKVCLVFNVPIFMVRSFEYPKVVWFRACVWILVWVITQKLEQCVQYSNCQTNHIIFYHSNRNCTDDFVEQKGGYFRGIKLWRITWPGLNIRKNLIFVHYSLSNTRSNSGLIFDSSNIWIHLKWTNNGPMWWILGESSYLCFTPFVVQSQLITQLWCQRTNIH